MNIMTTKTPLLASRTATIYYLVKLLVHFKHLSNKIPIQIITKNLPKHYKVIAL